MNKLAVILAAVFAALLGGVALSLDNSSRPTPEQDDAAYAEWQDMHPMAREILCDMYEERGEAMFFPHETEGLVEAKIDLMERECD